MGIAVSCAAFLELPTMALINKIMKKISVKNLLLISGIAFFIKHLLMLIAPNMAVVYISQAFQMFAYAVFIPAGAYFVNRTMARLDQVKGQAYINCSITLGGVFSSLVCGRLLDIKGVDFMLTVSVIVTGIGLAIAFVALKLWREKHQASVS
jgi:PPP family 3-phenylpropionic acid transporter